MFRIDGGDSLLKYRLTASGEALLWDMEHGFAPHEPYLREILSMFRKWEDSWFVAFRQFPRSQRGTMLDLKDLKAMGESLDNLIDMGYIEEVN